MVKVDEFLKGCKQPAKEKVYRPITAEELKTKKEIIEYLINNKNKVGYSERVFRKLENILNEISGGK